MWSVVLADHPHGARTVQHTLCSLIFQFIFGIGIQSVTNEEKNPMHENYGVRAGTCGSLSQTQRKLQVEFQTIFPNPL